MEGQTTVTLLSRKKVKVAQDTINVKRIASKVTVNVCVEPSIEVTKITSGINDTIWVVETWVPVLDDSGNLTAYLNNASTKSTTSDDLFKVTDIKEDLFTYNPRSPLSETTQEDYNGTTYDFYHFEPFYTSPVEWEYSDPDAPYVKIVCQWQRTQTVTTTKQRVNGVWGDKTTETKYNTTAKNFYYKLALPGTTFKKNNWYNYKVYLGLLGSDTDDAAVEVNYEYYVVDWSKDTQKIETSILDARYLSVAKDTIYLYNEESVNIPYVTSHDCKIIGYGGATNITHSHLYLKDATPTRNKVENIDDRYTIELDTLNNERIISFNRTLNNTITDKEKFDFTVDTTKFRICHADGDYGNIYYHDIVIIQYPAIYADFLKSNSKVFVNEQYYGYYWWNDYYDRTDDGNTLMYVYDDNNKDIGSIGDPDAVDGTANNTNQNLYKLYVTVLEDDNLFIADPREETGSSISNINSSKAKTYRATKKDAGWAVAPAFMNASSYGKTTAVTYNYAVERCATYQEAGYPAGRWRIPTKGEIKFVVSLSVNEHIPSLFNSQYWCASGEYFSTTDSEFHTETNSSATHFVRCVYDLWYWGDDPVQSALTTAKWSDNL